MSPEELLERLRAFQESRILLTAIELDVFSAVGGGATAAEVTGTLGTDPRATEMLLNALVALGVLEKRSGAFRNSAAARCFVQGAPGDQRLATLHLVNLWQRWSTLTEAVRTGTAAELPDMAQRGVDWTEPFIAAMHANASQRAPELVQAVNGAGLRRMLDLGGGSGAYSIAFANANPELSAEVLDLPTVVPITQRHVEEAGLAGRVTPRAGDLKQDSFGSGYDLVLLSQICHMFGPEENRDLLGRAFQALAPGGRIVIQEFILNPDRTGPKMAAVFALNMLVGTRNGSTYTAEEYASWLRGAGCAEVRRIDLPGPTRLMLGKRPN